MLPMRWSQPPCMNIEVNGVCHDAMSPMMQTAFSPTGKRAPGGAVCKSSPGISPQAADGAREQRLAAEALQQRPREHVRGDERVSDDRCQEMLDCRRGSETSSYLTRRRSRFGLPGPRESASSSAAEAVASEAHTYLPVCWLRKTRRPARLHGKDGMANRRGTTARQALEADVALEANRGAQAVSERHISRE